MEIITRKYALSTGLPKYFTGKKCSHGHLTYRYTKSGSCSACISAANGRSPLTAIDDAGAIPQHDLRRGEPIHVDPAMVEQLRGYDCDTTMVKVAVYDADANLIHEVARNLLQARYPAVDASAFRVPLRVHRRLADGVALYLIRCHPADSDLLTATGHAMIQGRNDAHRVAERVYEAVLARSLADADAEHPGPPPLAPGVLT